MMGRSAFEWTPANWQGWRESTNPYRQFKSERDRMLVLQALQLRDGDSILELGCGYGWISKALLEAAKIRWIGVDRAEPMVRHLRISLDTYRPRALVADGARLPFRASSFDKVLCTGVLMHVAREFKVLEEMERVLRPGGLLLCSMNNAFSPLSWIEWVRNLPKKDFTQNYRRPATYRHYLKSLRLKLLHVAGDGLFSTGVLRLGRFGFPPAVAFPVLHSLDRVTGERFVGLAHELWFTALKAPSRA
jgi:SAM-dependent methyltransferase